MAMPAEAKRHPKAIDRIRRSSDGKWVVRRNLTAAMRSILGLNAQDISELYLQEIDRLQKFGLAVISFASIPEIDNNRIYTVSPWIQDTTPCDKASYELAVLPILRAYYREWSGLPTPKPDIFDVSKPCQYSLANEFGSVPFLHDIGPEIEMVY